MMGDEERVTGVSGDEDVVTVEAIVPFRFLLDYLFLNEDGDSSS